MDREIVATIVLAILASNGLFALLQFLITRHDTKKNIKGKLAILEKDVLRTQLLLLLLIKPEEKQEILTLGEHYFKVLQGNWYMTSIFNRWLAENNVAKPEWFNRSSNSN